MGKNVETKTGELLHLSQACLAPDTVAGASAKVLVEQEGQSYAVACLREGGQEFCALDLFLNSSDIKFAVKGKATVHLTGYFECDVMDDDDDEMEVDEAATKGVAKAASKKTETTAEPKVEQKKEAKPNPENKLEENDGDDDDDDEEEEEEEEEEDE